MQAVLIRHIFALLFSFVLGLYLVPLMIRAAYKLRFLDQPDGLIKQHEKEIPYLGGVAVFISFLATIGLIFPFENHHMWFLIGITLLLFIGLVDDFMVLRPRQKFLGQFIAVLCFLKGGISLRVHFFSTYLNIAASVFWMLSIINAFNLVDVMDGLSSTIAIVAAASFLVIALMFKQYAISLLLLALIGALSAFFLYNKPPAKIYLGDAGSMFVGGFFAAIPLLFSWSSIHLEGYVAPLLILGVPLLEVATLVVIRTYKGIPFYRGSPDHFAIYLKNRKWSVPQVLLFSGFSSLTLSIAGILFLLGFIHIFQLAGIMVLFSALWFGTVFYRSQVQVATAPQASYTTVTPAVKTSSLSHEKLETKFSDASKSDDRNSAHF